MRVKNKFVMFSCYFPILIAIIFSGEIGLSQMSAGFFSIIAGIILMVKAKDIDQFKKFSCHQFIGILVADILAGVIFLSTKSNDVVSAIAAVAFVLGGLVVFAIQYLIDYLISRTFQRNRKN